MMISSDPFSVLSLLDYAENGDLELVVSLLEQQTLRGEITANIVNMKCPETGMTPLMCASQGLQIEIVRYLLRIDGIDINVGDKEGDSAIVYACKVGCLEIIDLLVSKENVNQRDSYGLTLLMCAIKGNHQDIASLLITRGADITLVSHDDQRYNQWTVLMFAEHFECLSVMKLLYSNGLSVGALNITETSSEMRQHVNKFIRDDLYRTPLEEGVYTDDLERVKHLVLNEKLDVNQMHEKVNDSKNSAIWKVTPLFLACYLNRLGMVKLLLQLRADKSIECGGMINHPHAGWQFQRITALMLACSRGYIAIVNALQEADVYYLVDAATEGNSHLVRHMLTANKRNIVDARAPDTNMNALLCASFYNQPHIVKSLVCDYGANSSLKTSKGFTSLMLASVKGHTAVVAALLDSVVAKRNLLINELDGTYGYNALQWASFKNHKDIMNMLVNNGADVISLCRFKRAMDIVQREQQRQKDSADVEGFNGGESIDLTCWQHSTPLHQAVYDNDLKKIHEIVISTKRESKGNPAEMSAILDAVDEKHGWSALIVACYFNRISVVKALLSYGVDVSIRIKPNECSAIYVASSRGHFQIVDILAEISCAK